MPNKKRTKAGTDPDYSQFLSKVEIYALGLDSLSAKVERDAYFLAHSGNSPKTTREIENHFKLIEFGDDHFDVRATFVLRVRNGDGEEVLWIQAIYTAHFHTENSKVRQDNAQRFARTEARLVFWPYFRQVVADTTSRMFIRTITIPLTAKL
jgi:hypothetical protein